MMSMFVVMPAGVLTTVIVIRVAGLACEREAGRIGEVDRRRSSPRRGSSPVSVTSGNVSEFSSISIFASLMVTPSWMPA